MNIKYKKFTDFEIHIHKCIAKILIKEYGYNFIEIKNSDAYFIKVSHLNISELYNIFLILYEYNLPILICCYCNYNLVQYLYRFYGDNINSESMVIEYMFYDFDYNEREKEIINYYELMEAI